MQVLVRAIQQLSSRPFVRNVAVVASGTAASQAIAFAFSPIITRLYGPEAYGLQGLFMSIAGLAATVSVLSYHLAIVLPKRDVDASGVARLSIYVGFATTFFVTIILFFFGTGILLLMNAEKISAYIFFIPAFMMIAVFRLVMAQWLVRKHAFNLIAKVTVLQTIIVSTVKAGFGFVNPTAGALIVVNTLSGLLLAIMMFLGIRKKNASNLRNEEIAEKGESTWDLAMRYRDFPLLRAPQLLINAGSKSLPIFLLASYFGPTAVGFYAIATTVLTVPAQLIGYSIMQVFYPKFNEAYRQKEDVSFLLKTTTAGMAIAGAFPFVAIVILGPILFEFVFGEAWGPAGEYARWLAIWLFFSFMNTPSVAAVPVLRLQKQFLIYEIASIMLMGGALYLGFIFFKDDIRSIAIFSIAGGLANAVLVLYVLQACKNTQESKKVE